MHPTYGITKELPRLDVEAARARVIEALKAEGFGVITEIDLRKSFKEKLGLDFEPYFILGACNPTLASKALKIEPWLGLFLPCNVVVRSRQEGGSIVSAIDPEAMFELLGSEDLKKIAQEVRERLARALERL